MIDSWYRSFRLSKLSQWINQQTKIRSPRKAATPTVKQLETADQTAASPRESTPREVDPNPTSSPSKSQHAKIPARKKTATSKDQSRETVLKATYSCESKPQGAGKRTPTASNKKPISSE